MNVQTKRMTLLPAAPGTCPECAVTHGADQPHNKSSLFYQIKFSMRYSRTPTWEDAMAHCEEKVKKIWREELKKRGVDTTR